MAMRIVDVEGSRSKQCPCSLRCEGCGKTTYRNFVKHNMSEIPQSDKTCPYEDVRNQENEEGASSSRENSVKLISKLADFLPALEKSHVKCPRCRIIYDHSRQVTLNRAAKYDDSTSGICDHCRIKAQNEKSCDTCADILKIFLTDYYNERPEIGWLELLKKLLIVKNYSIKSNMKIDKNKQRTYSDVNVDEIFNNLRIFKSSSEVRLKFRMETKDQSLGKELENIQLEAGTRWLDLERHRSESFIRDMNEETEKYLYSRPTDVIFLNGSLPNLDKIDKYALQADTLNNSKKHIQEKTKMKITGILKRGSTPTPTPVTEDTISYNAIQVTRQAPHENFLTTISTITKLTLNEGMKYFFPQAVKVVPIKQSVSSSELIHDTQEMLRMQVEENKRKKQEDSIRKHEEVRRIRDLKNKLKLEKKAKVAAVSERTAEEDNTDKIPPGIAKSISKEESIQNIPKESIQKNISKVIKSPKQKDMTKISKLDKSSQRIEIEEKKKSKTKTTKKYKDATMIESQQIASQDKEFQGKTKENRTSGRKYADDTGEKNNLVKAVGAKGVRQNDVEKKDIGAKNAEIKMKETKVIQEKFTKAKDTGTKETRAKDVSAKDMDAKDIGTKGAGIKDARAKDIVTKDVKDKDIGAADISAKDMVAKNVRAKDIEPKKFDGKDIGEKDIETKGVGAKGTGAKDVGGIGNINADSLQTKNTRSKDVTPKDTGPTGTGAKDSGLKNKGITDTEGADTIIKDIRGKDTRAKDATPSKASAKPNQPIYDLNDKNDNKADKSFETESSAYVKTFALSLKEDRRGSMLDKQSMQEDNSATKYKSPKKKLSKDKLLQKGKDAEEDKLRELTEKKVREKLTEKSKGGLEDSKKQGPISETDKTNLDKAKNDLAILELKKNLNQQQKESEKEDKLKKMHEAEAKKITEAAERKLKEIKSHDLKQKDLNVQNVIAGLKKDEHINIEDLLPKDFHFSQIQIRRPSTDDLILKLIYLKQSSPAERLKIAQEMDPVIIKEHFCHHTWTKNMRCLICLDSNLELDIDHIKNERSKKKHHHEIIVGEEIVQHMTQHEIKEKVVDVPMLFQTQYFESDAPFKPTLQVIQEVEQPVPTRPPVPFNSILTKEPVDADQTKGIIRYALSDRTFIDKGWTMLPTEKVVRKMNVYRMRPAHPEFDWFEHNKNKKIMSYDSGERLAEFEDNGRGRWFYRNGRLALDYYDAEEVNAQQRVVIYSSGEPDERGRAHPITVLAMFDYLGNGVVFDHGGKIRLKYNQTEGVVLDRGIGPVSHWKWHTLNDPPVLQQVMIDTQMPHKDPDIVKLGPADAKTRPDNEDMLAIEFDNFIKEKSKKLTQSFKPFQIKMKALKINENFSLRVLDQATVYLMFRDGTTNLKLNIGMVLDHKEIVDTDTAELGEVSNSLERFPARTDSLAALQRSVAFVQRYERNRTERERRLRPPEPSASADQLTAGASRPMRPPFRTLPNLGTTSSVGSLCKCSRRPSSRNVYYNSRLSS